MSSRVEMGSCIVISRLVVEALIVSMIDMCGKFPEHSYIQHHMEHWTWLYDTITIH
jgi:hypothetical protein